MSDCAAPCAACVDARLRARRPGRRRARARCRRRHGHGERDLRASTWPQLVKQRRLTAGALDEAVRRILASRSGSASSSTRTSTRRAADAMLADAAAPRAGRARAAQRSMVLLRTRGRSCRSTRRSTNIAVIGPLADAARHAGPWWGRARAGRRDRLDGIRARSQSAAARRTPRAADPARPPSIFEDARRADEARADEERPRPAFAAGGGRRAAPTVVLRLGETADMSGEAASRALARPPGRQQELLRGRHRDREAGRRWCCLTAGRSTIRWAAEHVPAILEAWYPGTEGGNAVADVLFGDVEPGRQAAGHAGRASSASAALLQPQSTATGRPRAGTHSRYRDEPDDPLYPFGYGLSYTTFAYSNLRLGAPESGRRRGRPSRSTSRTRARRRRRGRAALRPPACGQRSRPVRELKGFRRVTLAAGERRNRDFTLGPDAAGAPRNDKRPRYTSGPMLRLGVNIDHVATRAPGAARQRAGPRARGRAGRAGRGRRRSRSTCAGTGATSRTATSRSCARR